MRRCWIRRVSLGFAALALAAGGVTGCGPSDEEHRDLETRALMREIFTGLRVALPASAEPKPFGDPAQNEEILAALIALADNAALLESHAARRDEQERFFARSVARDARDVLREYRAGHAPRAAFLLQQITENCIACHTRLPAPKDSPLTQGFLAEPALEDLPLEARARLQIATRRFDEALDTLEALIASDEHPVLLLGPITDYLVVNIRVKGDFERPLPTLARFAERPDLWTRLRRNVERWIEALPGLRFRASGDPDVDKARSLIEEGRALDAMEGDHASLAHLVVASSVLQRYVAAKRRPSRSLAEAYYLLGVLEVEIGRSYWVTPAPFLLEQAVRIAPDAPFAMDAFALLEQELLMSYEGADEDVLPAEDVARLRELESLLGSG